MKTFRRVTFLCCLYIRIYVSFQLYSGTSVFDLFPIRTIWFSTKNFELKMLPNSNRAPVFEHSRAGNENSRVEPKRTQRTVFLLKPTGFLSKRRERLLPSKIHLQRREREGKKNAEGELPNLI